MNRIVDRPQQSDMGSGFGHIEKCKGIRLSQALEWIKQNNKTWGIITIIFRDQPIRIFDYDIFNDNIFYHHLSGWEYNLSVEKIEFEYCFMCENITIYVRKS